MFAIRVDLQNMTAATPPEFSRDFCPGESRVAKHTVICPNNGQVDQVVRSLQHALYTVLFNKITTKTAEFLWPKTFRTFRTPAPPKPHARGEKSAAQAHEQQKDQAEVGDLRHRLMASHQFQAQIGPHQHPAQQVAQNQGLLAESHEKGHLKK